MKEHLRKLFITPPEQFPLKIDPPVVPFTSRPEWRLYCQKRLYIFHPSAQSKLSLATVKCPFCSRTGAVRLKGCHHRGMYIAWIQMLTSLRQFTFVQALLEAVTNQ